MCVCVCVCVCGGWRAQCEFSSKPGALALSTFAHEERKRVSKREKKGDREREREEEKLLSGGAWVCCLCAS